MKTYFALIMSRYSGYSVMQERDSYEEAKRDGEGYGDGRHFKIVSFEIVKESPGEPTDPVWFPNSHYIKELKR